MSFRATELQRSVEPTTSGFRVRVHGDEDATLVYGGTTVIHLWNRPLTANRTATLSESGPPPTGARMRIVRGPSSTGAFVLNVDALATLATSESVAVEYDGANWILDNDAPALALDLTALVDIQGDVLLEWTNSDSLATSIEIHRSTTEAFTPGAGTLLDTLASSATEYEDTGV